MKTKDKPQAKQYVIYSRKSKFTGKGESIENQIELCRQYIAMHFGEEAAENALVYEDEGFSGGNLERPQFKKMMKDAQKKDIAAIVVYRLDRISRNIGDFAKLMAVTDTVLLDIKHIDDEAHRRLTRFGNANILDCARYLSDIGKPVWIRHVLVPGITDDEASLVRLHDFLCSLSNIERIDVLPYHTLGTFKYEKLGIAYPLRDTPTPTPESVARARNILEGTIG